MSPQTIILLVAIVMLGIGVWANIRMKPPKEFLVAGQSLGFFGMATASSFIQSGPTARIRPERKP
ncbi:hypothetical protein [Brevibacterium aurantiacum]|uniref:Uncharacterized protein n=1 Tax=Brevibacterium aurantiacum TaxID=273384 RepID=A0A2H1KMT6_BREAU|nr:hypothetical protein [Brevibacterium aurantiacum]SMY01125.1 hypothetical protein BAUR920_03381 [Brevibacterium aurantiacum]